MIAPEHINDSMLAAAERDYDPTTYNCGHFTAATLRAAGVKHVPTDLAPDTPENRQQLYPHAHAFAPAVGAVQVKASTNQPGAFGIAHRPGLGSFCVVSNGPAWFALGPNGITRVAARSVYMIWEFR